MITGGVNPYTTRLRLKLYRVANYNGLNPKRCWTKCPWRGVVHPVAVIPGAPWWGCLLPWQVSSPVSASAWPVHWWGGLRCPWVGWQVSSWDQSYWSRVTGICVTCCDSCHPGVPWGCLPVLENRAFLRPGMRARLVGAPLHTWISQIVRG